MQIRELTANQQSFGHVSLGATGVSVTPMGIGTWAWGDRLIWGYGKGYGEADLQAAFEAGIQGGVNFFDTAEIYGNGQSEMLLGRFARRTDRPVMIATKFLPFPWRLRRTSLLDALRRSLARLEVERVDLYQMHWPLAPVPIETWMDAMADAVEAGLVRAVGVSNYSCAQMRRAHAALASRGIPLASNQVKYSLLHRAPERNGLVQACRELNVTLIAYGPIAQGLLTGKFTPSNPPPGRRGMGYDRERLSRIQSLVSCLREIGTAHGGKTSAQVALNWVVCKGAVPIPGVKNVRQTVENLGALGWRLSESEMLALDQASERLQS